jgi:hypothetical protein
MKIREKRLSGLLARPREAMTISESRTMARISASSFGSKWLLELAEFLLPVKKPAKFADSQPLAGSPSPLASTLV